MHSARRGPPDEDGPVGPSTSRLWAVMSARPCSMILSRPAPAEQRTLARDLLLELNLVANLPLLGSCRSRMCVRSAGGASRHSAPRKQWKRERRIFGRALRTMQLFPLHVRPSPRPAPLQARLPPDNRRPCLRQFPAWWNLQQPRRTASMPMVPRPSSPSAWRITRSGRLLFG